jgi:ABC transporter DrrB family efflux protein
MRFRWALTDGWTITARTLTHWSRQPYQILLGLLFPVLMVLMFGYLLGGGMRVPGGGGYREFLLPGMFAMTMAFGLETTFSAVATDASKGVTDRFRTLPMARSAVVTGRCAADMINSLLGLAVMLATAVAAGWRFHHGLPHALAAVGLLLLLRMSLLWVGIYLALIAKGPEALVAIQILVWPVAFLSSAFTAPSTMPAWLGAVAEWNPLSATVAAARELFGNPGWGGGSWIAQHGLLMAAVWPIVITGIFFPLSVRRYHRMSQ